MSEVPLRPCASCGKRASRRRRGNQGGTSTAEVMRVVPRLPRKGGWHLGRRGNQGRALQFNVLFNETTEAYFSRSHLQFSPAAQLSVFLFRGTTTAAEVRASKRKHTELIRRVVAWFLSISLDPRGVAFL